LDPFHDQQFEIQGLPDQYGGSTCVQLLKKQVQIVAPAGISATDKWEVMIHTWPMLDTEIIHQYDNNGQRFRQFKTSNIGGAGTVTITKSKTTPGRDLFPSGIAAGIAWSQPDLWSSIGVSPTDGGNSFSLMRLIGGGFEVHDTTPELYKGGSVTVFTQPQTTNAFHVSMVNDQIAAPTVFVRGDVIVGREPPVNLNEVILNTTARTWEGKEGAYVPFRIQPTKADYTLADPRPLVLRYSENSADYSVFYNGIGVESDSSGDGIQFSDTPNRRQDMHMVGAYFSGLAPEAVLTLDIRFFVEIAPTPSNATLLGLASPSPEYDPVALELYTRALGTMLPGCKVKDNASGDWWRVVSSALQTAAPIVSQLGPWGAAAGSAARVISNVGDMAQQARQKKKQQKELQETARKKVMAPPSPSMNYAKKK